MKLKKYSDYIVEGSQKLYHNTMSDAFRHVEKELKSKGVEFDQEEFFQKVSAGPRKPTVGQTNSYNILLKGTKGKKQKFAHVQVYGMDNGKYELNWYAD